MLKFIGILLIIIILLIAAGYLYLRHWAYFFVDAVLQRDNLWYEEDGRQMLNPGWKKQEVIQTNETFWQTKQTWRLATADGLRLQAAFFDGGSHNWVVCFHSYRSDGARDMARIAEHYYQAGYNVLVPDLRAHGESQGEIIGLGWLDRLDVIAWVQKIVEHDADAKIILQGESIGAAAILMASGEKLPSNVKLLISDSSYTSVYSEFHWMLRKLTKYPINRFMKLANKYAKKKLGYSLRHASVTRQLGSNHLPVLFLHGRKDQFIPVKETATLMEATAGEKQLKIFDGADHLQAKVMNTDEYWQTISDFIKKYF